MFAPCYTICIFFQMYKTGLHIWSHHRFRNGRIFRRTSIPRYKLLKQKGPYASMVTFFYFGLTWVQKKRQQRTFIFAWVEKWHQLTCIHQIQVFRPKPMFRTYNSFYTVTSLYAMLQHFGLFLRPSHHFPLVHHFCNCCFLHTVLSVGPLRKEYQKLGTSCLNQLKD